MGPAFGSLHSLALQLQLHNTCRQHACNLHVFFACLPPTNGPQAISFAHLPCLHGPYLITSLVMLQSQTAVHPMCVSANLSKKTLMPLGIQKQHCRYDQCTQLAMQQECCPVSILVIFLTQDLEVLGPQNLVALLHPKSFHPSS